MRRALLLVGGTGTRLSPLTDHLNKHLLPVGGRPMVCHALDTVLRAGATEVRLVCNPGDVAAFEALLGDGAGLGCAISYGVQPHAGGIAHALAHEAEFCGRGVLLALGDNLLLGPAIDEPLSRLWPRSGAVVLTAPIDDPTLYGVAERDADGVVVQLREKPAVTPSREAVIGLYGLDARAAQWARELAPSPRGEVEIIGLLQRYLAEGGLSVVPLPPSTRWLDLGTHEHLALAEQWLEIPSVHAHARRAAPARRS